MSSYSVQDLLVKAEELLQSINTVPLARQFYAKALEMEPDNTAVMDDYAECLLELEQVEEAAQISFSPVTLTSSSPSFP